MYKSIHPYILPSSFFFLQQVRYIHPKPITLKLIQPLDRRMHTIPIRNNGRCRRGRGGRIFTQSMVNMMRQTRSINNCNSWTIIITIIMQEVAASAAPRRFRRRCRRRGAAVGDTKCCLSRMISYAKTEAWDAHFSNLGVSLSLSLPLSLENKCAKGTNRPKEGSIRNLQFVRWRVFFSCLGHGAWSTYLVHCRWVPTLLTFLGNQAVSGFKWTMRPTGTNVGRWRNGQNSLRARKNERCKV